MYIQFSLDITLILEDRENKREVDMLGWVYLSEKGVYHVSATIRIELTIGSKSL